MIIVASFLIGAIFGTMVSALMLDNSSAIKMAKIEAYKRGIEHGRKLPLHSVKDHDRQ